MAGGRRSSRLSSSPGVRSSRRTNGRLDDEDSEFEGEESPEEQPQASEDEDDEDEKVISMNGRARRRVNYNEDEEDEDVGAVTRRSTRAKVEQEESEEDAIRPTISRKRKINSDDSDFEASESEVSDDFVEKLQEKNFIATDDEDADMNYIRNRRNRKKKRSRSAPSRSRPRRSRAAGNSGSEDYEEEEEEEGEEAVHNDTLQQELDELRDSSPPAAARNHQLRERKQVNYEIPPPITHESQLGYYESAAPATPKRRPTARSNAATYRKLLFPTAGPFGGSDVISLFGKNIPGGGMTGNAGAINDSDSSDDEIRPEGVAATPSKAKLINGSSVKKNTLADSDPLGVDMNIDFSVVGGLDTYINQLKEMVALPLLYPEVYQRFGITPPRGVLFHGPPGTGKTLMARALAASCSTTNRKITFFMRKGADVLSKWVGEAERQLRLLFEQAKEQQPSIIFFDEIDGLAPVRSSKQEQIHASIVSTLLALMDGMDNRGQVIVIGATNRPDSVDPALRRPGRFDREFYFPLPDIKARSEILKIHTRKWEPALPGQFLDKIAHLTKGYGGADLRALCTEAALNSVQRKYPQIYQTNDKLKINPSKITVVARDFMRAVEKIVPSSARNTSSGSAPLPDHLAPLLSSTFKQITDKLDHLVPQTKKLSTLEEALYVDLTAKDKDGGFARQEMLKKLDSSRICKPRLLISGDGGSGQQYLGAAILNHLEGFHIQALDLGSLFSDSTRTPEASIIERFIEARRHQPSIIFVPNIDIWYNVVTPSAKATLSGLLRSVSANERILLLGISELKEEDLDPEVREWFGFTKGNNYDLLPPTEPQVVEFFKTLESAIRMKPLEFNDIESRPKRKLKQLKVLAESNDKETSKKEELKKLEYNDNKLKNTVKIKLAGLMDLFKNRYKRFKKPIIDEMLLTHLFEPQVLESPNYLRMYEKSDNDKIIELSTGRQYFNMDLEIVEERLWNGFYSEPKQFLKDIKQICQDAITSTDRERILKANEMYTNAQFGIDEFSTPDFLKQCKEMHLRDIERQKKYLSEQEKLKEQEAAEVKQSDPTDVLGKTINGGLLTEGVTNESLDIDMVGLETEANETAANGTSSFANGDMIGKVTEPVINGSLGIQEVQTETEVLVSSVDESASVEKSTVTASISEEKGEPESESSSDESSEEEYEETQEEHGAIVIDDSRLSTLLRKSLPSITKGYSIERLEQVNAKLMDIIWQHRKDWDKTEVIAKLEEESRWFEEHM